MNGYDRAALYLTLGAVMYIAFWVYMDPMTCLGYIYKIWALIRG